MFVRIVCGVLLAAGFAVSVCSAEVIDLKSGHRIVGDVLKEQADAIYVDIGINILRVPLDEIKSRKASDEPEKPADSAGGSPAKLQENDVYTEATLPQNSVNELAQQFGEGVVLVQTTRGLGSGFIINKRGYCVTNYHVIEKETRISVTIFHRAAKGEFTRRHIDDVKILSLNPFFDLALLQIPLQEDFEFQPVYLAKNDDQREGDLVFAIGNPLGLERSVSQGIVSTRTRNMKGLVYIQTTTQINPGNSGGPLFNSRGEVVGVTNMKLAFGEGLGFAIPVAYLKNFLKNREAFAFDKKNPNTGYRYLDPPRRTNPQSPPADL